MRTCVCVTYCLFVLSRAQGGAPADKAKKAAQAPAKKAAKKVTSKAPAAKKAAPAKKAAKKQPAAQKDAGEKGAKATKKGDTRPGWCMLRMDRSGAAESRGS